MPAVAVAGAVFAGAEIATVGLAAMSAFEVVAAVGAIASGIGAVTGNEDLMKIGGVAALAGGVGMFATKQGWIGAADAASSAAEASNIGAMKGAAAPGMESAAPTVDFGGAQGSNSIELGQAAQGVDQSITAQAAAAPTAGLESAAAPLVDTAPGGLINAPNPTDLALQSGTKTTPLAAAKSKSILDSFTDLLKDKDGKWNKDMLSMAGNFIGGAFDDRKKNEAEYLKARTNELNTQMRNVNAIPDLSGMKVDTKKNIYKPGAPQYNPVRVGLINAKA